MNNNLANVPHELEAEAAPVSILIVDDREDKRRSLEIALAPLKHQLHSVSSGEAALEALAVREYALVILDVRMPGIDGYETAARMRALPATKHTPIIFVTGLDPAETHVAHGYSLGAVDYLYTPIEPEILRAKVAVFVDLFKKSERIRLQGEWVTREAERRALQMESRLHGLLNRLDVGVFRCTREGKLIEANPAFLRVLGASSIAEAGTVDLSALQPKNGQEVEEQSCVRLTRTDGAALWASLSTTFTETAEGIFIEGILEDITSRKEAEDALRQADRRKDEFLAMLSHELRNPLNAMHSALQLEKRAPSVENRCWAKQVIESQMSHLTRLVDDLLDVSRITRGKIRLRPELVVVANVVQSAVQVVRPLIEERRHKLVVCCNANELTASADPARLQQMVVNLLTNAAKYTERGGTISVTIDELRGQARIKVSDTGIGISKEMLPHIFDIFTQADHTLDRAQGGLGIGLTLVQMLARLHGGTITAQSEGLGKGSEFVLSLPLVVDTRVADVKQELRAQKKGSAALRVLLVEDNRDSAEAMRRFLEGCQYYVAVAHDGIAALEMAKTFLPHVVLLDIGLPGMDGYEVARQLRQLEELRGVRLIAITGYGQERDRKLAKESGLDFHLIKPVNYDDLLAIFPTQEIGTVIHHC